MSDRRPDPPTRRRDPRTLAALQIPEYAIEIRPRLDFEQGGQIVVHVKGISGVEDIARLNTWIVDGTRDPMVLRLVELGEEPEWDFGYADAMAEWAVNDLSDRWYERYGI